MSDNKLKVEIWSDVACPFCYIGKREFEKALQSFPERNQLNIEWKSYQLDPDIVTDDKKSMSAYLSEIKGMPEDKVKKMHEQLTLRAAEVGLNYHFEKAIPANTMNAHSFSHFAKKCGKQDEAEELLFRAHFTEGKNIDSVDTLLEMAGKLNLDREELKKSLEEKTYFEDVRADIYEAFQLGVRGVPFFVFDRKYAVSGAQPDGVFTETIKKSWSEWKQNQNKFQKIGDGESCDINGNCN